MIKIQPDQHKAKSLRLIALETLKRLKETALEKYPTNTLSDYYDITRKLMSSIALLDGVKFKGEGTHQKLIDYVCQNHNLGEQNREFIQQLRDYRNRISYEGFVIKPDFIQRNKEKIEEIINRLNNLIENLMGDTNENERP